MGLVTSLIVGGLAAAAATKNAVDANQQKIAAQKQADKIGDQQEAIKQDTLGKIDAAEEERAARAKRMIARERGGTAPGDSLGSGTAGTTSFGTTLGGSQVPAGMGVSTTTYGAPSMISPLSSTGGTKTLLGS
jgi:hypothetical protein